MIEARGLTKRFGDKLAVDQLSFTVEPGRITGFLGPNGAGKTTTMRLILGLDHPTGGSVSVNGREFPRSASPMREVGALLDAKAMHGGRSAYNHLLCLAQTNGLPRRRVGEVLDLVGLTEVAGKRSKGFSLGMGQRLGIAAAQPDALAPALRRAGGRVAAAGEAIVIHGLAADKVGDLAYENGIRLHELAVAQASLEEAYMEQTAASVEFRAGGGPAEEQAAEQD